MLRDNEVKLIVPELDKALAKLRASGVLKRKPESRKKRSVQWQSAIRYQ